MKTQSKEGQQEKEGVLPIECIEQGRDAKKGRGAKEGREGWGRKESEGRNKRKRQKRNSIPLFGRLTCYPLKARGVEGKARSAGKDRKVGS